jgi:hypothetical protein
MEDEQGFKIQPDEALAAMKIILDKVKEEDIHPVVGIIGCALAEELLTQSLKIPRKDLDKIRRIAKKMIDRA